VNHLNIVEFVTPETFQRLHDKAMGLGFAYCASGPLVRSSYKAGEFYMEHLIKKQQQQFVQHHVDETAI
jgi:lipoic acid synthetase